MHPQTEYNKISYTSLVVTDISYTTTTLYETYAGFGIMCDNVDIYCDSEDYYCDGSVAYAKTYKIQDVVMFGDERVTFGGEEVIW